MSSAKIKNKVDRDRQKGAYGVLSCHVGYLQYLACEYVFVFQEDDPGVILGEFLQFSQDFGNKTIIKIKNTTYIWC